MAFGIRHWLAVVVLSLALISVWRLPLDFVTPGQRAPRTAEEIRHTALVREFRDTRALLDQIGRARSLPGVIVSAASEGVSVIVPEHTELAPGNTAMLRDKVRAEVRDLGLRDPSMVVGYAYDGDDGGATGLAVSRGDRVETYLGEQNGNSYCLQVVVTRPSLVGHMIRSDLNSTGWTRWTGSLLGPCALYATHGPAGPSVQEWLEAGGLDLAQGRRGTRPATYPEIQRRSFMAIRLATDAGEAMESEHCLSGEAEACAAVFLDPDLVDRIGAERRDFTRRSPAIYAGSPGTGPFPFESPFLLFDLEREFGPDAFEQFWTSDDEVRPAFEAAFGVDLGEWVVSWLDRFWGVEPARPAPTLSATLGSLLFVSLVTGLAVFVHRRRQVA